MADPRAADTTFIPLSVAERMVDGVTAAVEEMRAVRARMDAIELAERERAAAVAPVLADWAAFQKALGEARAESQAERVSARSSLEVIFTGKIAIGCYASIMTLLAAWFASQVAALPTPPVLP